MRIEIHTTEGGNTVITVSNDDGTDATTFATTGSVTVDDNRREPNPLDRPKWLEDDLVHAEGEPTPILRWDLTIRVYNALARNGITTLEQLSTWTESGLRDIPNFGTKSVQEVRDLLHSYGKTLRRWNPEPYGERYRNRADQTIVGQAQRYVVELRRRNRGSEGVNKAHRDLVQSVIDRFGDPRDLFPMTKVVE